VGLRVPPEDITPYVIDSVKSAVKDLSPATAAASTGWCEGVVVFGSQRISQLASTVNAMLTYVAPLGVAILGVALIFSVIAYLILL
jgi:putative membrane protein